MKAYPVAWHQECLKNFKVSMEQKKKQLANLTTEVARMEREAAFRQLQIDEALLMGKEKFDEDRYLQHRKPI